MLVRKIYSILIINVRWKNVNKPSTKLVIAETIEDTLMNLQYNQIWV